MQKNIVVLMYSAKEIDKLSKYASHDDNDCVVGRIYSRADWGNVQSPLISRVVSCGSEKSAFQLRLRFNTMPSKGVEFL